jgi:YVTN family beta-propeller protein
MDARRGEFRTLLGPGAARLAALLCAGAALLLSSCASRAPGHASDPAGPFSPSALAASADGTTLFVAEATADRVAVVDIASGTVTRTIQLDAPPNGLALAPDGRRLVVTTSSPDGLVCVINVERAVVASRLKAGHTPNAPVLSPDGAVLYVCNRFTNDVSVIDLASGDTLARIPVEREPVAAALTPDGARLLVANLLPVGRADGDMIAAAVSVVDTAARRVVATVPLTNGSTGLRGICVSPDGTTAYVTHVLGRYHLPTTQLERGWMNTNALSIIDVAKAELVNTVLLDDVEMGAANPWAVACTADGKWVCVTHAGTQEMSVIDRAALHERLGKAAGGERMTEVTSSATDVPNDLSFLVGVRRRIALAGEGPRALAVVGSTAYVAEYFTDSLSVVELDSQDEQVAGSIALGPPPPLTPERRGEMLFCDARPCFQHWQSCTSCHPDARADGLNWDLLNDGFGNPKNTRSLLLSHRTPPVMITGVRPNAETAVRAGLKFIEFAVRPEEDAAAIDAYLRSLEPVPSPYLADGNLSTAARRGQTVFREAHCAACHTPPLYTNMKPFNVGTGTGREQGREFDTPTLVEIWRTAPYLYDGRAATMREVLTTFNQGETHGATSSLSEQELSDLIEFVLSQ